MRLCVRADQAVLRRQVPLRGQRRYDASLEGHQFRWVQAAFQRGRRIWQEVGNLLLKKPATIATISVAQTAELAGFGFTHLLRKPKRNPRNLGHLRQTRAPGG